MRLKRIERKITKQRRIFSTFSTKMHNQLKTYGKEYKHSWRNCHVMAICFNQKKLERSTTNSRHSICTHKKLIVLVGWSCGAMGRKREHHLKIGEEREYTPNTRRTLIVSMLWGHQFLTRKSCGNTRLRLVFSNISHSLKLSLVFL